MLCLISDLLPSVDAATEQSVDVFTAVVHEATDEPVITEDDAGHLGNVLPAFVVTDIATVIHQARHEVTLPQLLGSTFFNLHMGQEVRPGQVIELQQSKEQQNCHYLRNGGLANLHGHRFKLWVGGKVQFVVPQQLSDRRWTNEGSLVWDGPSCPPWWTVSRGYCCRH